MVIKSQTDSTIPHPFLLMQANARCAGIKNLFFFFLFWRGGLRTLWWFRRAIMNYYDLWVCLLAQMNNLLSPWELEIGCASRAD